LAASTIAPKARPRRTAAAVPEPKATPAVPFEPLADSLGYAIKLAQVRTYALLFRVFDSDCLSPGRMTALWMIASDPRINQTTLAQRLSITRASVVKVVDSLEKPGLVQRLPVPGDRRSYALVITALGLRELERHRDAHARFEAELATGLTRNERRQLMQLLEKVAAG
jgi:DNA-binding MarR family transcriptional regulator